MELFVGVRTAVLVDRFTNPLESNLIAALVEVPVKLVRRGVQPAAGEPFVERWITVVECLIVVGLPVN